MIFFKFNLFMFKNINKFSNLNFKNNNNGIYCNIERDMSRDTRIVIHGFNYFIFFFFWKSMTSVGIVRASTVRVLASRCAWRVTCSCTPTQTRSKTSTQLPRQRQQRPRLQQQARAVPRAQGPRRVAPLARMTRTQPLVVLAVVAATRTPLLLLLLLFDR